MARIIYDHPVAIASVDISVVTAMPGATVTVVKIYP